MIRPEIWPDVGRRNPTIQKTMYCQSHLCAGVAFVLGLVDRHLRKSSSAAKLGLRTSERNCAFDYFSCAHVDGFIT